MTIVVDNIGEFEASVSVQLTDELWKTYLRWATKQRIRLKFHYGKIYFKRAEDALAFRLRFGA